MRTEQFGLAIAILKQEIEGINFKYLFMLVLLEAIIVFFSAYILRKKKNINYKRLLLIYLFLVYTNILFSLTIFRRADGSREGLINLFITLGFGFRTGHPQFWAASFSFLNILLFIPFGLMVFLLLGLKDGFIEISLVTIVGAVCSLLIECTQLVTGRGIFEISDILTNTTGCFIGAIIAAIYKTKKIRSQ